MGFLAVGSNLVNESLVSIGWDGRPAAKLASRWEWSPDRRTLSLELDQRVKFHDGTPLTAPMAVQILKERLNPKNQGVAITYGSVRSVEAASETKMVIALSRPEAFFLADLANATLTHPSNGSLGTGPFKYVSPGTEDGGAKSQKLIRLERFDDYYRGRPILKFVEVKRYEEQRGAWAGLMRGDVDAVHEASPGAMDFVEKQSTVKTFPHTRPYFIQLLFNLRHPALKNPKVRQALSHAVDRPQIVKAALHDRGVIADGPIWPQHWAYSAPAKTYSLNPEVASLLLNGYPIVPSREPGRMNSRFRFVCLTLAADARYEKIGIILQKQFYDIGVDMEVVALPYEQLGPRVIKGDFDALLLERTSGRSLTWAYLMYHSALSPTGYRATDAPLDQLRSAASEPDTRAALNEFQRILHEDPPAIFLAWPVVARAVSTTFEVPGETGRDVMGSIWQWRPTANPRQ